MVNYPYVKMLPKEHDKRKNKPSHFYILLFQVIFLS